MSNQLAAVLALNVQVRFSDLIVKRIKNLKIYVSWVYANTLINFSSFYSHDDDNNAKNYYRDHNDTDIYYLYDTRGSYCIYK